MWKFCGKGQFPHSFGLFAQNYVETVSFHKMKLGIFHCETVNLNCLCKEDHFKIYFETNKKFKKIWYDIKTLIYTKTFKNVSTTILIIFWDVLINDQIFFSPQVKRSVIISNKHGIWELPHELPNDLRLRILKNWEILGQS